MAKEKKSALEIIVKDSKTQTSYVGDGCFLLMMFQKNEDGDGGRIFRKARVNFNQQEEVDRLFLALLYMAKEMIGKRPYLMELLMKWLDGAGDGLFKELPQEPTAKVEDPTSGTEPKAESCAPKIEDAKKEEEPQGEGEPARESAANG